jgi:hypothetical protein
VQLVEIVMDKVDAPESLKKSGAMIDAFNAGKLDPLEMREKADAQAEKEPEADHGGKWLH